MGSRIQLGTPNWDRTQPLRQEEANLTAGETAVQGRFIVVSGRLQEQDTASRDEYLNRTLNQGFIVIWFFQALQLEMLK